MLKEEAVKFMKNLFCSKETIQTPQGEDNFCKLTKEERKIITNPISKEEVHRALMSMKSFKALGPDGFQPVFYKLFWDDMGDDVWKFLKSAFEQGFFDPRVTEMLLVLIPKGDSQTSFKDFRPISLCNVIFKLISMVLVSRLRPMLSRIVSPLQSSFISGRGTVDNAIILQEVLHYMHKSKRKQGDVVLKLDLEKAYDRADWDFLKETLILFGFPGPIISLIMHGITSSFISLLWNESRTPSFLLVEASDREIISLHIFLSFAWKGLKVSKDKSRFYASKRVCRDTKDKLLHIFGVRFTDRITKYLGFQMFQRRPCKEDFESVIERVNGKPASWKGKLLNKPGE